MWEACKNTDMPHKGTVFRRMAVDATVATAIARAREAGQDAISDRMRQTAASATPETWQVARLKIWTDQWLAAKLAPKKYGAVTTHRVGGEDGGPIPVNFDAMSEAQIANFIQRLERRDQGEGPGGGEGGAEPPEE
jgi:hypothetical protein